MQGRPPSLPYKVSLKHQYSSNKNNTENQRQAIETILKYLSEQEKYLWDHIIQMPKSAGGGIKTVCRTNNGIENFNGRLKQEERKRSGRKVLAKDFEDMPERVPLIKNLKKSDYIKTLCGSLENIPVAIAKLEHEEQLKIKANPTQPTKTESYPTASLPKQDRQFIRKINIALLMQNAAVQNDLKTSAFVL